MVAERVLAQRQPLVEDSRVQRRPPDLHRRERGGRQKDRQRHVSPPPLPEEEVQLALEEERHVENCPEQPVQPIVHRGPDTEHTEEHGQRCHAEHQQGDGPDQPVGTGPGDELSAQRRGEHERDDGAPEREHGQAPAVARCSDHRGDSCSNSVLPSIS